MIFIPKMIMLSGSGKNVGKTTLSTQLIHKFTEQGHDVYAIKTSSHQHTLSKDEKIMTHGEGYDIVEEHRKNDKDSSLMLQAGAIQSYYIQARADKMEYACKLVLHKIPANVTIICESGGLREYLKPSLFLYLKGNGQNKNAAFMHLADKTLVFNGSGWNGFNLNFVQFNGTGFELRE